MEERKFAVGNAIVLRASVVGVYDNGAVTVKTESGYTITGAASEFELEQPAPITEATANVPAVPVPSSIPADPEAARYVVRSIDSRSPSSKFPELRDCGGMSFPQGMAAARLTIEAIVNPPNPGRIVGLGTGVGLPHGPSVRLLGPERIPRGVPDDDPSERRSARLDLH